MKPVKEKTLLHVKLDKELHDKFKSHCALSSESMTTKVVHLIQREVQNGIRRTARRVAN